MMSQQQMEILHLKYGQKRLELQTATSTGAQSATDLSEKQYLSDFTSACKLSH